MVGIGRRRIVEVARKDHRVGRSIYFDPDFTYLPGTDTTVVFQLAQYSLDGCVAVVIFPEPAPELGDARSLEVDGEETHRIIADEQVGTQVVVVRIGKPDVFMIENGITAGQGRTALMQEIGHPPSEDLPDAVGRKFPAVHKLLQAKHVDLPAMALAVAGVDSSLRNPFTLSVAMRMSCGLPLSLKSGS